MKVEMPAGQGDLDDDEAQETTNPVRYHAEGKCWEPAVAATSIQLTLPYPITVSSKTATQQYLRLSPSVIASTSRWMEGEISFTLRRLR